MPYTPVHRRLERVLDCRVDQSALSKAEPPVAPTGLLLPVAVAPRVPSQKAPAGREVSVASLLDHLSAEEFALLRRETRRQYLAGTALWRCPCCREPVFIATRSVAETGTLGGLRGFFKHHARRAGSSQPDCPLALERGQHPDLIDALRFDGSPMGPWHAETTEAIGQHLTVEPGVDFVLEETPVQLGEAWRKPDLLVRHELGTVAVEIQHASPQIGTVMGREAFYGALGMGVLWIVDADDPGRLVLQGMQDIAWPRDGVVYGWSDAAQQATLEAGRLQLHRLTMSERNDQLVVEDVLVPFAAAVDEVMALVPPRPMIAQDGLAEAYLEALLSGDEDAEQEAFAQLRVELGLTASWYEGWQDGLAPAVATTVTALTGRKALASGFAPDAAAAILNSFFEAPSCRPWAPLVLSTCESHACADERLSRPSTARKIAVACAEAAADPTRTQQLRQRWGGLFDRLFPASYRVGR